MSEKVSTSDQPVGEVDEEAELRGYCAHCNRPLYTSESSDVPSALDGGTRCEGSPITRGLVTNLTHELRY